MTSLRTYKYQASANDKKVLLKDTDMRVLAYLFEKKFLSTHQMTDLYCYVEGRLITYETVVKKLYRYTENGKLLIKRTVHAEGSLHKRAFYHLKEDAIHFLKEHGYVQQGAVKSKPKIASHAVASREVLTRTLRSIGLSAGVVGEAGQQTYAPLVDIRSFFLQKGFAVSENPYKFIPDEMLSIGERVAFVEMDMQHETQRELMEKVERYIGYAEENPQEQIGLFLVTLDGSLVNPMTSTVPYGRLRNFLFALRRYHETLMTIPNLRIYATSLQDAGDVIAEFLLNEQYTEDDFVRDILQPLADRKMGDARYSFTPTSQIVRPFYKPSNGIMKREHVTDERAMRRFVYLYSHENEYRYIAKLDDIVNSRIDTNSIEESISLIVLYPKRKKTRDVLLMDTYTKTYLYRPASENSIAEDETLYLISADSQHPGKRTMTELY